MKILAIDTSCDDTCIAVLEIKYSKVKIKSNVVSSQVKIHQKYGGVYPSLAKREHQRNLPIVLKKVLKEAGFEIFNFQFEPYGESFLATTIFKQIPKSKIDIIAVTVGPGLEPCLWTGINFAKDLVRQWKLPIIPVNHIEAHIFANFVGKCQMSTLRQSSGLMLSRVEASNVKCQIFPAICLVVSGGHTQLILMNDIGKYKIIGETRDDAAGECFDKTARVLGLPYPGGPAIAAEAAKYDPTGSRLGRQRNVEIGPYGESPEATAKYRIKLPRPMINTKDYDFSFSGLKTAVLYDFKKRSKKVRASKEYVREMAREIQQAIIDVLIKKTIKAAKDYKAKSIILGGGVTANTELRKQFNYKLQTINYKLNFLVPPKNFCTDNAVMIGATAYFHRKEASKKWQKIKARANLRI